MPVTPQDNAPTKAYVNHHYAGLSALLLLWLICFWSTLSSMVEIWQRSDTFAHGFLIFPISAYLIWQKRRHIAATALSSSLVAALPLSMLLLAWFFADAVNVNVVKQLAVVLMLPILVWLCCGRQLLSLLIFPLAYLIFAVPMGDALVAPMQLITADITVAALRLANIPVYREGLYLSTPTGLFLVAEACSGVRYLIASFALGTLYAYLNYRSWYKQLAFCLASILVPILANGIRAFGIVLIAHLTDMKHAVGVDHLIYGWLFFGVIIFLMFYIGSFWADRAPATPETVSTVRTGSPLLHATLAALLLSLPFTAGYLRPALTAAPVYNLQVLQNGLTAVPADINQPQFIDSSASLSGKWRHNQQDIWFYSAFYQHVDNAKLVSWHNQPYQRAHWTPAGQQRQWLDLADQQLQVQEFDLRANDGSRKLLWYWYGSGDYFSANPYLITVAQALGKVFHISQHGSFYALSINYVSDVADARQQLQLQLQQQLPLIKQANNINAQHTVLTALDSRP
ncbi:exosortase A [Rheinheimera sp. YQF-2]|uniref:Exosortase A n=1 Tax=Rheinheimera lutimaris TaxID=2740584 RepID=A0A7Y5APS5_9GAMM|nr:exosortase A [Rheinheimera lutimaris]NRQ42004.1 exosortase A [Rheinheimera lutimaris]